MIRTHTLFLHHPMNLCLVVLDWKRSHKEFSESVCTWFGVVEVDLVQLRHISRLIVHRAKVFIRSFAKRCLGLAT